MPKATDKRQVRKTSISDRYVVPNRSGGWDIIKEGHRRATGHAETKADAIRAARTAVRRDGGGELRVVNQFGKLTGSTTVVSTKRRAA